MNPSRAAEERLEAFASSLVGMSRDGVTVESATAAFESRPDVGDVIIRVQLGLSDPPAGRLTWPVKALHELERGLRERAYAAGLEEFAYVNVAKAHRTDDSEDGPEPTGQGDRIPLSDERPDLQ